MYALEGYLSGWTENGNPGRTTLSMTKLNSTQVRINNSSVQGGWDGTVNIYCVDIS